MVGMGLFDADRSKAAGRHVVKRSTSIASLAATWEESRSRIAAAQVPHSATTQYQPVTLRLELPAYLSSRGRVARPALAATTTTITNPDIPDLDDGDDDKPAVEQTPPFRSSLPESPSMHPTRSVAPHPSRLN